MVEKLRLVGICSSPRKKANSQILLEASLEAARSMGSSLGYPAEVELVQLAGRKVSPCLGCDQCAQQRSPCIIKDDWHALARPLFDPMPDGIIFSSPVYFFNQNSLGRAYMERCTSFLKGLWDPQFPMAVPDWSTTAAGAVAVGFDRNGGVEFTLTSVLQWFLVMGFVIVGGFYIGGAGWTGMRNGRDEILHDTHGLEAARLVGRRVAKTGVLLKIGRATLGNMAKIDTSWASMQVPLVKGGDH